jgi:hypothetical protein
MRFFKEIAASQAQMSYFTTNPLVLQPILSFLFPDLEKKFQITF